MDPDKIREHYELQNEAENIKPNYNAAPSQQLPVIVKNGKNRIEIMRWGLVPFWAKDESIGFKTINARAEGIESKPVFRKAFKSQHCLIPAEYFFEWDKVSGSKIPYLIKLKNNVVFSMAGLYDTWKNSDGREIGSFTIITTEPNHLISHIHNRMPVILDKNEEDLWLDPNNSNPANLLDPYPASEIEMYKIGKLVNSPYNNFPGIIKKIEV